MITIKTAEEIAIMREGGRVLAEILAKIIKEVKPGVSTFELNNYAEKLIKEQGGEPSFKGYGGFPAALCTSVNEAVVHGVPDKNMVLGEGDIIGLDIGMRWPTHNITYSESGRSIFNKATAGKTIQKGLYLDMARTVGVGKISSQAEQLIKITRESFYQAMRVIKAGATIGDIGYAIQSYVERYGYSVVRIMSGHGVGYQVHEEPQIPNYGEKGKGAVLKPGMVLAIEPMVCAGGCELITLADDWTAVTTDKSLTAHYENTLVVTNQGAEILTHLDN